MEEAPENGKESPHSAHAIGMDENVINTLVSSANKIGIALWSMALGKSLMYTRNNSGPKIEPSGTPCFILVYSETVRIKI